MKEKEQSKSNKKTYYSFYVDENDIGRRIDRVLRKILSDIPLSGIFKLLRNGKIKINDRKTFPAYRLKKNDTITLPGQLINLSNQFSFKTNSKSNLIGTQALSIKSLIIKETEDFIAINKPKGMLTHGKNSLNTIVLHYLENSQRGNTSLRAFKPGPIHRLDRNTSGIVLFSKSIKGAKEISKLLKDHKIVKTYLAIVEGEIIQNLILKDILYRDPDKKKTIVITTHNPLPEKASSPKTSGKLATTHVYPITTKNDLTLAICIPITGKTHQIRAQLANSGYPLFGDTKYGGKKNKEGFFLHAFQIIVKESKPLKGLKNFFAPIPKESYIMLENCFGKINFTKITEKIKQIAEDM